MESTVQTTRSDRAASSATPTTGGRSVAYQANLILQVGFVAAPIIEGLDKFFNVLVDCEQYLSPFVADIIPPGVFMGIVGVVEIIAGIGVAVKPRIFAYVVSAWLLGIILNLLMIPGYYDVALRDLGLSLGALAFGRLAQQFDRR